VLASIFAAALDVDLWRLASGLGGLAAEVSGNRQALHLWWFDYAGGASMPPSSAAISTTARGTGRAGLTARATM
jgi:hypothetical protein